MAEMAATDVTVTLTPDDFDRSPDKGIITFPSISFGNGSLTYPSGGIPMPDLGKFGMQFALKRVLFEQPANGNNYCFDRANHKLRIFTATATEMSGAIPATTLNAICMGR